MILVKLYSCNTKYKIKILKRYLLKIKLSINTISFCFKKYQNNIKRIKNGKGRLL